MALIILFSNKFVFIFQVIDDPDTSFYNYQLSYPTPDASENSQQAESNSAYQVVDFGAELDASDANNNNNDTVCFPKDVYHEESSSSSFTNKTLPENSNNPGPSKRKTNRGKKRSSKSKAQPEIREKNRLAAAKYRGKRKSEIDLSELKRQELHERNEALLKEIARKKAQLQGAGEMIIRTSRGW